MNLPDRAGASALTPRQQILRRKMNDDLDKLLRLQVRTPQAQYARQIATERDWTIRAQPVRQLPYSLTQLITPDQRDRGNALIEETRLLNNQYTGVQYRDAEVIRSGDLDCLDLRDRVLAWGEEIADEVIFKLRNKSRENPYRTFHAACSSFVSQMDREIAHGTDRLYQFVWSRIVDMLPYKLLDAMLFSPGHCTVTYSEDGAYRTLAGVRWLAHACRRGST